MKYLFLAVFILTAGCANPGSSSDETNGDAITHVVANHQADVLVDSNACGWLSRHDGNYTLIVFHESWQFEPNFVRYVNSAGVLVQAPTQTINLTGCNIVVFPNGTYQVQ